MAESMSGMSEQEAEEFHKYYLQGLTYFVAIAVVAHLLVWFWRPWFAGDSASITSTLTSLI